MKLLLIRINYIAFVITANFRRTTRLVHGFKKKKIKNKKKEYSKNKVKLNF